MTITKLNALDKTDTETISAFRFVFIDSSIASQVAGDYAISRQKKNSSCIWAYGHVKTNHYQNFSYA